LKLKVWDILENSDQGGRKKKSDPHHVIRRGGFPLWEKKTGKRSAGRTNPKKGGRKESIKRGKVESARLDGVVEG